ncbi:hypothetical protein SANTM175S_07179 [Streptomyces antimycoticus]
MPTAAAWSNAWRRSPPRAISLSRFRLLRPLVKETHDLLADFMPTAAGMAASGKPKRAVPKAKTAEKKAGKKV